MVFSGYDTSGRIGRMVFSGYDTSGRIGRMVFSGYDTSGRVLNAARLRAPQLAPSRAARLRHQHMPNSGCRTCA